MQAVTTMELEAVRRQEILLASAGTHRPDARQQTRETRPSVAATLARLAVAVSHAAFGVLARI